MQPTTRPRALSPRPARRRRSVKAARVALLTLAVATSQVLDATPALAADDSGWSWQLQWLGMAVNLLLIGFLVLRFARPGLRRFLEKRKEGIDRDIAEAESLRERAEARLEELETRIASLDAERQRILDEYRALGESEKERIVSQARSDAERIRRDAQTWSETELARARGLVEREITALALTLAEEKLRTELQPQRQRDLVEQAISGLVVYGDSAASTSSSGGSPSRPAPL